MPIIVNPEYDGVDVKFFKTTLESADIDETFQTGLAGPIFIEIAPGDAGFYTQTVTLGSMLTADGSVQLLKVAGAAADVQVIARSVNSRRMG